MVVEAWDDVAPKAIVRSAVACGLARVCDFSEAEINQYDLRSVKIDPVIQDLVSTQQAAAARLSDLEAFANVVGIDLDDPEEREHAEAMMQDDSDLDDGQDPPVENSESFESGSEFDSEDEEAWAAALVLNGGGGRSGGGGGGDHGSDSGGGGDGGDGGGESEMAAQKQKRQRHAFNAQQIAILSMEERNGASGQGRASNRDIAARTSGLAGGRAVTGDDVGRWFRNARAKRPRAAQGP
jgi:hypothetical protein